MTPEGKVKKEVKDFLDALGPECWYYMPVPMGYGKRGVPDFIGCYAGHFFAIEAKASSGELSPWQKQQKEALSEAGSLYWLVKPETIEEFKQSWNNWFR